MVRIELGSAAECGQADALKAALAEFISMVMFVFAGQGSAMAFNKLTNDGATTPEGLVVAALAHAFAIIAAISVGANISGGHVNPVVTLGALIGGNITLARTILYWIAQCLGSVVACLILKFATGGLVAAAESAIGLAIFVITFRVCGIISTTTAFSISSGVTVWNALVFEIVLTFGLIYTVYATVWDPKRGNIGIMAPVVVGAIVAANILAGAAFEGASMNPALSFGPAVVSWTWDNHWVYWLGPFTGSAIAALVYDTCFITSNNYNSLPTDST